jgi:hypothetical protein
VRQVGQPASSIASAPARRREARLELLDLALEAADGGDLGFARFAARVS